MDIIQTCETIELWINSCKTREQLELLEILTRNFITAFRFPDESVLMICAAQETLKAKIQFKKERMLFNEQPVLTDTKV